MRLRRWTSLDWLLLVLIVSVAAGLRLWSFSDLGLSHFDEGGYGMSALGLARGDLSEIYPLQRLLSPPLWFGLAGFMMRVAGGSSATVMLALAVLCGVALVGLLFALGLRWYGRVAGSAAALVLALSDFHIVLSRSALTDALFVLCLVGALGLYEQAERTESYGWALWAGVATGLAWNTKYHGWLACAIASAGLLPYLLNRDWRRLRQGCARIAAAASVAFLMYLPWFLWVQGSEGGYAYLARYQAAYLEAGNALANIREHLYIQRYLTGSFSLSAVPLALAVAFALRRRLDSLAIASVAAATAVGAAFGLPVVALLLALIGAARALRRRDAASCVLLGFLVVFAVLSPLYKPYARLLMPWLAAVILLAGLGVSVITERARRHARVDLAVAGALILLSVVAWVSSGDLPRGRAFRSSQGIAQASQELASRIPPQTPIVVIGEPAVVFYLRTQGVEARHLDQADDLYRYHSEGDEIQVIVGRYGRDGLAAWRDRHPGALVDLGTAEARGISEMRLLDDFGPWVAAGFDALHRPDYDLDLLALKVPTRPAALPGLPLR